MELVPANLDLQTSLPNKNPAIAYLASLPSETSRKRMHYVLLKIVRLIGANHYSDINWQTINAIHAQAIIARLTNSADGKTYSPSTIKLILAAIKGIAKKSWELDLITTDTYQKIKNIKPPRGSRLPAGRDIERSERFILLHTINKDISPKGKRDKALFALLISTGMRRAEALSLTLQDIDLTTGKIKLVGKGNKERTAYIKNGAEKALKEWLEARGLSSGALFCVISKGQELHLQRHLSPPALNQILQKRIKEAGLKDISLHDFRRTFAGDLLDANIDISTVSSLMGHSNVQTTAKYDRRGERTKEEASRYVQVDW